MGSLVSGEKMNRKQLKSLVKECLFEILLESTTETADVMMESKAPSKKRATKQRPALDSIAYNRKRKAAPSRAPSRKVAKNIDVSSITSDPVMASIFQDTARNTLQEQIAAERGAPVAGGDAASLAVAQSDPSQLFGEASQNWAALAFSETPKK